MCGVFPHTDQFSDISGVSYNSVQFRHYLPGLSVDSTGEELRLTTLPPLQTPIASPSCHGVTCPSDLQAIQWVSHNLLFGFDNVLEGLTELRETHVPVYNKRQ